LKFGIVLPVVGFNCKRELLVEAARVVEDLGFDSLWVWDHYMLPASNASLDAWILLSHLSAVTSNVRLGTVVTPIPLRPPTILAKITSTVDILSGGRVILGVGAGWHRPEFEGYSEWNDDATRVSKTEEGVRLILKLWTEDRVDFEGRFYSARGAVLEPKPIQKPHPPIWFGTYGRRMLKITARYGDGWIPVNPKPEEYREACSILKEYMKASGRSQSMIFAAFDNRPAAPTTLRRRIEELRGEGCEYYTTVWDIGERMYRDKLKIYAEDVVASFR